MKHLAAFPLALLFLTWSLPLGADNPPIVLFVKTVIAGDEFILSDGRQIKLEGIKAPGPEAADFVDKAKKVLQLQTEGYTLALSHVTTDHYNGTTAHVDVIQKDGSKTSLECAMLKSGFAFIYPPSGNEEQLPDMFKCETIARAMKIGIWANYNYADLTAHAAGSQYGRFAFVVGTVVKTEPAKDAVHLNFGADWRKNFTIAIAEHDLKSFSDAKIDANSFYTGKKIRVRGWIKHGDGPVITVTHPSQIEVLPKS